MYKSYAKITQGFTKLIKQCEGRADHLLDVIDTTSIAIVEQEKAAALALLEHDKITLLTANLKALVGD